MSKPAITVNFNVKPDKETTLSILNELKYLTGEDNPVILNKSLRNYRTLVKQRKGNEKLY